jgi:uncharacterized membrane protein
MRDNTAPANHDAGHYLLLLTSIFFAGELFLFLTKALHEAGHQQQVANRFLVLSLGVFVTAIVAFYGFARRIERTIHLFFGVLLLQPAVDVMAKFVGGVQTELTVAAITGAIGAVLTCVALNTRRQTSVSAAEMSQALRARALTANAEELGIESAPGKTFVVVMDLAYAEAVVSLVCTSSGDASLYFSNGGGVVGGGEHQSVRTAATSLLRESDNTVGNAGGRWHQVSLRRQRHLLCSNAGGTCLLR